MRKKTSLAAFAVVILIAAVTAPRTNAAQSEDACALLTQAQVSSAVGVPVGAGSHVSPTFVKTCTWTPSGSASKDVKAVTISFQVASSYEAGKRLMEQSAAATNAEKGRDAAHGADVGSVSGIGDDAYYLSAGTGYTGLMVKKGSVAFKLAIYGDMPADKKKDAEKTLALQALSKL